jgi:hypothetical protein
MSLPCPPSMSRGIGNLKGDLQVFNIINREDYIV